MSNRQLSSRQIQLLIGTLALLFSSFTASAEIYRWVDEQGRTHYGDRPAANAEEVEIDVHTPAVPEKKSASKSASNPTQTDKKFSVSSLARCLRSSGAKYYTASWCPQCAKQRKLFGRSGRVLPSVECSVDGGREKTKACERAGIKSYPTWVFSDGSRSSGVQSLATLAKRSGCPAS